MKRPEWLQLLRLSLEILKEVLELILNASPFL
jgi:hypothetical protein